MHEHQGNTSQFLRSDRWIVPTLRSIFKITAAATTLVVIFLALVFSRSGILELNPDYYNDSTLSVISFVRIEGLKIFGNWFRICAMFLTISLVETLILGRLIHRPSRGFGLASVFFGAIFLLLSVIAIFYGVFETDSDFILSTPRPWLNLPFCLEWVARIAFAVSIGFILVQSIVMVLDSLRRGA